VGSTSEEKTKFSLVVLCYRSEDSIIPLVEKLHRMLSYYKFRYEIILVGNYIEGSGDRTPIIVEELARTLPNTRAVVLPKKGMMGWDMRRGLEAACGELVGVIDGDGQFPLESIFSCLIMIETEDLDLVKTYRVHREDGFYRTVISFFYNMTFDLIFGQRYRDVNSKPKIIRRSKLEQMRLTSEDWFTDAEIMIRAGELHLKVVEIPIHFYNLDKRMSFVKPQAIWEFIRNLWKYRPKAVGG
jgi:glycosyltransferase involved in cell wall biosynthesis